MTEIDRDRARIAAANIGEFAVLRHAMPDKKAVALAAGEARNVILGLLDMTGPMFEAQAAARERIATAAMAAIIAKSPFDAEPQTFEVYQKTAIGAVDYADALIAELNRNG